MKYCSHCGKEVLENAVVCLNCGCAIENTSFASKSTPTTAPDDAPSTGYAVLGFFIPLVGLILYLIWSDTHPKRAKSVGKGALIGFIAGVVLSIVSAIFYSFIIASAIFSATMFL